MKRFFFSSLLPEVVDLLSMRQTVPVAGFTEESHPGGVRQRAGFHVSDLRPEIQAQTPLAVTREMRASC